MKQFRILGGKCLVVELPEGSINPHIHPNSNGLWYKYEKDSGGFSFNRYGLPAGNWQILGMLPEVKGKSIADLVDSVSVSCTDGSEYRGWRNYTDRNYSKEKMCNTALESLESAIRAEGYTFQSTPKPENKDFYWGYLEDLAKWEAAQSRVLCRERTLILRKI